MSEFSERLSGLIFEHNLNRKTLAKNTGISATCITHYLQDKRFPTIKSLISIADYFNCSTDFLLGREEQNTTLIFKQCPPFSEQIAIIAKHFCKSYYAFYRELNIPESTFFEWKNGSSQPTLERLPTILIAVWTLSSAEKADNVSPRKFGAIFICSFWLQNCAWRCWWV